MSVGFAHVVHNHGLLYFRTAISSGKPTEAYRNSDNRPRCAGFSSIILACQSTCCRLLGRQNVEPVARSFKEKRFIFMMSDHTDYDIIAVSPGRFPVLLGPLTCHQTLSICAPEVPGEGYSRDQAKPLRQTFHRKLGRSAKLGKHNRLQFIVCRRGDILWSCRCLGQFRSGHQTVGHSGPGTRKFRYTMLDRLSAQSRNVALGKNELG